MIDRKVLLAIMGALPDEMLMKALSVTGLSAAGQDENGGLLDGLAADNKIDPWSAKEVTYGGGKDRPSIIDKMWAKPGLKNAQEPGDGGGLDQEANEFLQSGCGD